jgi:threonine dehydrogenase-like Zn-dependent dehydrogenase
VVGPIGLPVFRVLRKQVSRIFVTDRIDGRLAMAAQLGPAWLGNPDSVDVLREISAVEPLLLDCVFECSGDPLAIDQAIGLLKPGGRLVIVGIPETDVIAFPIHELRRKEITIINVRRQVRCTQKAIDLIAERRLNLDTMVTHRFLLEGSGAAFDLVDNYRDGVMKAMISIEA